MATIKSLLTSNGDMESESIFIFFDAIKGHLENVKAAQTVKLGGPLALVSTTQSSQLPKHVKGYVESLSQLGECEGCTNSEMLSDSIFKKSSILSKYK